MRIGHAGPFVDVNIYLTVVGREAAQGMIADYWANWDLKEVKVNPIYVEMARKSMEMASADIGKPYTYTGWIGTLPSHILILSQAMEKAGTTTDPDAIMEAIRGGTFDSTTGKYTMSGAKTYGSPVVFGAPSALSQIQGDKEVYLSEQPWVNLP
jgi:hypothetical protein